MPLLRYVPDGQHLLSNFILVGANILLLLATSGNAAADEFGNWIHSIEVFKKILSPIDNNFGDSVNDFNEVHPNINNDNDNDIYENIMVLPENA